jgi:tetratricopeptide (TPR) repeat protein
MKHWLIACRTFTTMRRLLAPGSRVRLLALLLSAPFAFATTLHVATASAQSRGAVTDPNRLIEIGNAALKDKRYQDARDAFAQASKLLPREAQLMFLTGYASFLLGQTAEARPVLERALALDPRLTNASIVLGWTLYNQGKIAEAVKVVETGLTHAPGNKELTSLLTEWRPELDLERGFFEARNAHFSVRFQGPSDDLTARRIVDLLEDAYYRIGRQLSTYPTEVVPVVLYTREQFTASTGGPDWAAGVYDGRIKVPTVGALQHGDALKRTLWHEFTHVIVRQLSGGAAPRWLNEGLARLLESDDAAAATQILDRSPRRLPHARLEREFATLPPEDVSLAYAQSALAVKKIIDLRGPSAVVTLLQALGRGTPFESAFQQSVYMRYEEFVAMIARY